MARFGRILSKIGRGIEFLRDLNSPGTYIPAETVRNPDGTTTILTPEIVIPQGPLASTTIRFALAGVGTSITAMITGWNTRSPEIFFTGLGTFVTSIGSIWRHIRSWMPVRGANPPVPTATHHDAE